MTSRITPGRLLSVSGAYWESCALHAAVRLDLFTAVGKDGATAESLARRLGVEARAVEMLLNALCAMSLLVKTGDRYDNGPEAAAYLTTDSPGYLGHIIRHHAYLVESWARLDQAVREGGPVRTRTSFHDEGVRRDFLMGMFNLAQLLAPVVAEALAPALAGRRRLLDLGGGPGTYAIHFCRRIEGLRAWVLDLPTTRPIAEETIGRFGMSDRIGFLAGDFSESDLPGDCDVVWISHILHAESPGDCRILLRKAAGAAAPEGLVLVHDFLLEDTMDRPLFPALFSLNMLLGTAGGQAYSEGQVRDMMADAGLRDIRRIPIDSPNHSGVLSGTA
jgi:hypothetical protein